MGHPTHISSNLPKSLQASMEKFQAKNTLPVFLKGGAADKALFGTTVGLCGLGLLGIAHLIYTMSVKK